MGLLFRCTIFQNFALPVRTVFLGTSLLFLFPRTGEAMGRMGSLAPNLPPARPGLAPPRAGEPRESQLGLP